MICSDLANFSLRRRVVALVEVDRGELVPGRRLPGPVADRLVDLQRLGELLPRRRVVALVEVDRGELVPGGRLPGPVADRLLICSDLASFSRAAA